MWYGSWGNGSWGNGSWGNGWQSLLLFLLIIAVIFVFIGFDGRGERKECER